MSLDLINKADEPQVTLDKLNAAIKAVGLPNIEFTEWSGEGVTFLNKARWYSDDVSEHLAYRYADIGNGHKLVQLYVVPGVDMVNLKAGTPYVQLPKLIAPSRAMPNIQSASWSAIIKWDFGTDGILTVHEMYKGNLASDLKNVWLPINIPMYLV